MWKRFHQPPILGREQYDYPDLPYGKAYFAVIDVEALVLHSTRSPNAINVVEQAAILLIDQWGREVFGQKHWVFQPMNDLQIAAAYTCDLAEVKRSSDAYKRITGDDPVHKDIRRYERWTDVRKRILRLCRDYALVVYAKGPELENAVLYGELEILDLAWYGAPKFPLPIHDPLQECRFFAQFVPDTMRSAFYIF